MSLVVVSTCKARCFPSCTPTHGPVLGAALFISTDTVHFFCILGPLHDRCYFNAVPVGLVVLGIGRRWVMAYSDRGEG